MWCLERGACFCWLLRAPVLKAAHSMLCGSMSLLFSLHTALGHTILSPKRPCHHSPCALLQTCSQSPLTACPLLLLPALLPPS